MDKQTFFSLIDKYRSGTATAAEKALLEAYYQRLESAGTTGLSTDEEQSLKNTLYQQILSGITPKTIQKNYWRWSAAAAILILLGTGAWLLFLNQPATPPLIAKKETAPVKDLPPGRNAATLTLADGKTIVLDSSSGTISQQGGVTVVNMSGMLSYSTDEASAKPVYNTVTTARGNQYQLILADGSKVWLNSASSLRFPTAFTGAQREVELDGEGYFEIAKNPEQPFIVHFNNNRVEVLGTHFNVNCYNDEETAKTTLVEGKIRIAPAYAKASAGESTILQPGQQAVLTQHAPITINHNVDIEQVMAWKNGWFEFDNTDLKTIMRQISRWYDVDIVYQRSPPADAKFGGRISRNSNLSNILKGLECEELQFKLEGKKLIVQ